MRRTYAGDLMGFGGGGPRRRTPEEQALFDACRASFRTFLRYWQFRNRETGETLRFATLWPGQDKFVAKMETERWIFALKAGKLGFTELECAYDAWVAVCGPRNARVHIFSRDATAARELVAYIRFGIKHLPQWMRPPFARDGLTQTVLRLEMGLDDVRTIVSYSSAPTISIDQSATHAHVDELAHMLFGQAVWEAVASTVAPTGSCHVVTRGRGEDNYAAELWGRSIDGVSPLYPFFAPWTDRPGRDAAWREAQAGNFSLQGELYFMPETAEDALAGDDTAIFLPMDIWHSRRDPDLPALTADDRTPLVVGVDAAVSNDGFAIVVASRHPANHKIAVIRAVKYWRPQDFADRRIDLTVPLQFLRTLVSGYCIYGHPRCGIL